MSSVLKGNFQVAKEVKEPEAGSEEQHEEFEREALRRLGGSIAFVSRRKFLWQGDDSEEKTPAES